MKNIIIIAVTFFSLNLFGQGDATLNNVYPINYFNKPLDIPLILSGTFAELRTNHFHAGLDIKTEQREGLKVYAAAEGFVSRIKISHWGYGKALYITHPNGYTTVYAHLKRFNKQIEDYIKKHQYKKESFEIQVFPSENKLKVSKNQLIAFSGSTGGFVGPHLHFEIRDTKTEKPINPMLFGITVNDSKKPRVNSVMGYVLSDNSHINQLNIPSKISFRKLKNGDLLANKITAYGTIGFGINTFDQLDGAYNKNGIFSLETFVNGKKIHEFKATSFSFSETKYINLLIDYEYFANNKQRIQKTFVEPLNKLGLYKKSLKNGYIKIEDGLSYTVQLVVKDFKGNSQKITIPISGKQSDLLNNSAEQITPYPISHTKFNKFVSNGVSVAFPKYTFYNDFYLNFEVNDSVAKVHLPTVPLHKKYTLTFDVSKYNTIEKKQLYIASLNKIDKPTYVKTVKKDSIFYISTKTLGKFSLLTDKEIPTIKLKNFKDGQWVTHFKTLQVKIADNESGIKSYRAEIDGDWILMEYNVKNGVLTYNLNDKKFVEAKHKFKVTVTDNVGNTNTVSATFYRKK